MSCSSSCRPVVLANQRGALRSGRLARINQKMLFPGSKQFPQITHSPASHSSSSRSSPRVIIASASRKSWDLGRFLRTFYFFNGPTNPLKIIDYVIRNVTSPDPSDTPTKTQTFEDVVLVTGATSGVGRRVVDILQKKGFNVRVLARDEDKARSVPGPYVDLIIGDVTKEDTLYSNNFKGIKKVVNAVSVIVGPKEGDKPDRQNNKQGMQIFEPEIKGHSPEMVEHIGLKDLINAVKNSIGLSEGKLLFGLKNMMAEECSMNCGLVSNLCVKSGNPPLLKNHHDVNGKRGSSRLLQLGSSLRSYYRD
ncbi:hypothetical protein ACP4OV_009996 [Aristida adscensionis]